MLQAGQLVGLLTEIVQQAAASRRGAICPPATLIGPSMTRLYCSRVEPRDQELAAVDHLRQAFELTALADEVRAHRQHDIDRHFLLRDGFQQQADELVGGFLLRLARFVEAKDFLELIDDQQEVRVGTQARPA